MEANLVSAANLQDFDNRLKRQYAQEQSLPPPIAENASQRDSKRTRTSSLFDDMLISASTSPLLSNPSMQAPFTSAPVSLVPAKHMSQLEVQQIQMMRMTNPSGVLLSTGMGQASGGLGIPSLGGSMGNTPLISSVSNPMASLGRNAKESLPVPLNSTLASRLMDRYNPKAITSKGKCGGGKSSLGGPKETMNVFVGVKTEMFEDGNAHFYTFTLVAPTLTEAFPISSPFSVFCLSFSTSIPPLSLSTQTLVTMTEPMRFLDLKMIKNANLRVQKIEFMRRWSILVDSRDMMSELSGTLPCHTLMSLLFCRNPALARRSGLMISKYP